MFGKNAKAVQAASLLATLQPSHNQDNTGLKGPKREKKVVDDVNLHLALGSVDQHSSLDTG